MSAQPRMLMMSQWIMREFVSFFGAFVLHSFLTGFLVSSIMSPAIKGLVRLLHYCSAISLQLECTYFVFINMFSDVYALTIPYVQLINHLKYKI
ncbi:hypothetical protein GM31_06060 [Trabulsiella odontotermitis]|uniref:Uncharacterized protein n=1 Tax=Trabulsiella odontotermitis TaxID=379893 RepID=A0A0L0GM77_9ENTR|nr:hypothetical protein GM31_06060 [Trabulsiella odontotermitis]